MFWIGAIAPQYALDACEFLGGLGMRAAQQDRVRCLRRNYEAHSECLSIQTYSIDFSQVSLGWNNFGCGIGPDFAIWVWGLSISSFTGIELYG
jgi:hypothetical protein